MNDAACVLIVRNDGLVLAVSRKNDHTDFGLPGGKVEPGEELACAAARELWEETGVIVAPSTLEKIYEGPGRTCTAHAFYARRWRGTPESREGAVTAWVPWSTLLKGSFRDYNARLMAVVRRT
jgi:8-oxo-dGTP pyrophosphatase MutT (NUDIX family)